MRVNELPERYRRAWEFEWKRTGRGPRSVPDMNCINATLNWRLTIVDSDKSFSDGCWWGGVHMANGVDELPPLPKCYRFKVTYEV